MACDNYDYDCTDDCVDAWELSRLYGCNESPTPLQNFDNVEIGDLLEFNQGGERIWGEVVEICRCYVIVVVTSDLVLPHPFSKGDRVLLNIVNIYNWRSQ